MNKNTFNQAIGFDVEGWEARPLLGSRKNPIYAKLLPPREMDVLLNAAILWTR